MNYKYRIYGYNVESDIKIDAYETEFIQPEVTIKFGTVNKKFIEQKKEWIYVSKKANHLIFYINKIGSFDIKSGKSIIIEPDEGVLNIDLRAYLLGFAFGFLMHQRGVFPLHGSTVDMGGFCLIFVGYSGAGKTTMALGLVERGFHLLSDEVSRIGSIKSINHVYPSDMSQRISKDTAIHMGIDYDPEKYILNRMDKFYVADRNRHSHDPKPLAAVIEIYPSDVSETSLIQLDKHDALNVLIKHSYGQEVMSLYADLGEHLRFCSKLAKVVPVYRLTRPDRGFTLKEQVDIIFGCFGNL